MYYPDWEVQARIEDFQGELARRKALHEHAQGSRGGVRTRVALALAVLAQKLDPGLDLITADTLDCRRILRYSPGLCCLTDQEKDDSDL